MTIHLYWWVLPAACLCLGLYFTSKLGDYGFSLAVGALLAIGLTVGHYL